MSLNFDREYFLDHCANPRNQQVLEPVDGYAEDINPICGDRVAVGIRIEEDKIGAIYFQGKGCGVSQAAASILTEMVDGKSVQEVDELSEDDLLDALGIPISPARSNCAFLSLRVLRHCLTAARANTSAEKRDATSTH